MPQSTKSTQTTQGRNPDCRYDNNLARIETDESSTESYARGRIDLLKERRTTTRRRPIIGDVLTNPRRVVYALALTLDAARKNDVNMLVAWLVGPDNLRHPPALARPNAVSNALEVSGNRTRSSRTRTLRHHIDGETSTVNATSNTITRTDEGCNVNRTAPPTPDRIQIRRMKPRESRRPSVEFDMRRRRELR